MTLFSLLLLVSAVVNGAPSIVSSAILDSGLSREDCIAVIDAAPGVLWEGEGETLVFLACRPVQE